MEIAANRPWMWRPTAHGGSGQLPTTRGRTAILTGVDGGLIPRRAYDLVTEGLADTRIVSVNGARQTGKSTLARAVAG